jgi:diguanylate cyclase (GGDEF)-like protein/PAS domain S-box-containing protein
VPTSPDLACSADAVLSALPDPVLVIDTAARLLWANRAAEAAFGWALDDLAGEDVAHLVHPDDLPTALASLASVQRKAAGTAVDVRLRDRSCRYRHFEVRGAALPGHGEAVTLVLRETTDRHRWELAGGELPLMRAIADHAPGITMLLDVDWRLRRSTRGLTRMLGRSLEDTLGAPFLSLVLPADAGKAAEHLSGVLPGEPARVFDARFTTVDGGAVPLGLTVVNLVDDAAVDGLVVTAVDITSLVEARSRLQHQATHDSLTSLPNRALLHDRLEHALAVAHRRRSTVGVLFCDVDAFKVVNDTHGHHAGDTVLVEVARRLTDAARRSDTVARLGGDEFVIVVEDVDRRELDALAGRVRAAMSTPFGVSTSTALYLGVSIGAAVSVPGDSIVDLLDRADREMYVAKSGRPPAGIAPAD